MPYQCVAVSVAGFVQQLAVNYVARGYYFYVTGTIPEEKDPAKTDRKIIEQYGIDVSKWARARRRKEGKATIHYLRCDRFYVIIATHGEHAFFAAEQNQIRDIRKRPLRFMGHAIGVGRSHHDRSLHVSVRIQREIFRELLAQFKQAAVHRDLARQSFIHEQFRRFQLAGEGNGFALAQTELGGGIYFPCALSGCPSGQ